MKAFLRKILMQGNSEIKLDKDYEQIFKPFFYNSTIFCMRPYNIKNNVGTPIELVNVVLAVLVNIFIALLYYSTLKWTDFGDSTADLIYFFVYSLYVSSFFILTVLHIWARKTNFVLLAKLQEIGDLIVNPEDTKILTWSTWTAFVMIIVFYISLLTVKLTLESHWIWTRGVFILSTIIFEMEVLHVSFIMIHLVRKLKKWRQMMMSNQVSDEMTSQRLEQLRLAFEMITMVQFFIKKAFQAVILSHFIMTFFQSLILVEVLIVWSKREPNYNSQTTSHTVGVFGWITKGLLIETFLCLSCEWFYKEISNIRAAIVRKKCERYPHFHVIQSYEELQRFCKCIQRIIDNHYFKMTACSVFTLDAALPLRFLALIATYIVVMLQFAFEQN